MSTGHPIDAVVHDDGSNIDVPPGRTNEVVSSDRHGIAIPHNRDHLEAGLGQLHPGSKDESSTMSRMQGIEVHINRKPS